MKSSFSTLFKLSDRISLEFSIRSKKKHLAAAQTFILKLLNGIFKDNELKLFMLAVDEVLQNAYEHGNLGISHEQKTILLENDKLDQQLKALEDKFGKKIVDIKIQILNDRLTLSVTDEGAGFDWQKFLDVKKEETALHGRGLKIIQAATDKIEFNQKGNSITLVKDFV